MTEGGSITISQMTGMTISQRMSITMSVGGGNSNRGSLNGSDGRSGLNSDGMGNGLGNVLGVGSGLVQGLSVVGLGFNHRFRLEDGSVFNDGLGNVLGGHNLAGGHLGNGGGFVDDSGLGNRVSDGGKLGSHLGKSMGLSHGISEVAAQTVVFNGGRVMGWCADQSGGQVDSGGRQSLLRPAGGQSQESGQEDKGLQNCIFKVAFQAFFFVLTYVHVEVDAMDKAEQAM